MCSGVLVDSVLQLRDNTGKSKASKAHVMSLNPGITSFFEMSYAQPSDNQIFPLFKKLIFNQIRTTIVKGIKNDFKEVKDCDTEFVGVALQSGSVLVTADEKLKNAVKADSFTSKCDCKTAEEIIN